MMDQKSKVSGQSLIEVLAALGVVVLVILALIIATTLSIRNATFAKNQSMATNYAQEGMELLRSCRDQDPESFWSQSCSLPSLEETFFERVVVWNELVEDEKMEVTVTVTWKDVRGTHKSELSTYLTKWQ